MEENQPITKMCPVTTDQMTEAFQKLYERISEKLPLSFSGDSSGITLKQCEGGVYADIPLTQQEMSGNFLDEIEEKLDLNVLYAIRTDRGQHYEAMAYSKPYEGELYVIFLESYQHGIINSMRLLLYDSFEPMFTQIKQNLTELENRKGEVMEREEAEVVYANFF